MDGVKPILIAAEISANIEVREVAFADVIETQSVASGHHSVRHQPHTMDAPADNRAAAVRGPDRDDVAGRQSPGINERARMARALDGDVIHLRKGDRRPEDASAWQNEP